MDNITVHFIRLAGALNTPFKRLEPISVTIERLSDILYCTSRNVKFILRKLEENAYIQWQPGRGRGHTSRLTFLRNVDEALEDSFQELMGKGKIKEAIELIGNVEVHESLKERLLTMLNKQMGYHSGAESSSGQDVLRMTRNCLMGKLDTAFVFTAFESYLLEQICNTLIYYDAANGTFIPGLAHMWEYSSDYTCYVFYLRKGVRFHHGRIMTARDVKETVQRLHDLNSPVAELYTDIDHIELEGDYCIRFYLSRPNLFFLHLFSCIYMSILPFDVDFSTEPIGTGPFRMKDFNENVLVLSAFDHYYGIRPLLDRVDIWFLPENYSNERQYQLHEITMNPMKRSLNESNNRIDHRLSGCRYVMFNFRKKGIHHHPAFRQAMRLLYDRTAMVEELGGNRICPANSFLTWNSEAWISEASSLDQAKSLLAASGYRGEGITLSFRHNMEEREEAEWLQQRCARVGLQMTLREIVRLNKEEIKDRTDMLICEEVLEDDWEWGMINYFKNTGNYLNLLLDKSQRSALNRELADFAQLPQEERIKQLDHAEAVLRDNYWLLYGCHVNKRAQLNQNLSGVHTSSYGFLDISKLWIKPGFSEADA